MTMTCHQNHVVAINANGVCLFQWYHTHQIFGVRFIALKMSLINNQETCITCLIPLTIMVQRLYSILYRVL